MKEKSVSPKKAFERVYAPFKKEDESIHANDKLDTKILNLNQESGSNFIIEMTSDKLDIMEATDDIKTIRFNINQAKKLCVFLNYALADLC